MQSSNPVFTRSEEFNGRGRGGYAAFDQPAYGSAVTHTDLNAGRMTIDSVVQRTAATLGVIVVVAAITWIGTGNLIGSDGLVDADVQSRLYALSVIGALGGFALSMVNSFKKVVSPALVLTYAAFEGLAIGAFSKVIGTAVGDGAVVGAVLGTVAAVAGTLTAYKVFDIQVGDRFRKWVIGAMFGFVAVTLLDFVLGMFHADLGFNGFGGLGFVTSLVGLGIGVLMLILDFDFVENGIRAGLPERESWRAAFGLSVTIVWIYIELLRLIAILRD